MVSFTIDDIPDLSGKVILITGGTSGLGKLTVLAFARHNPEHIYFTGRNVTAATKVIEDVKAATPNANISFIECDLASLKSVQEAAGRFLSSSQRLDILMCNAGTVSRPGATADGYEINMGTNHLGHALLIKLLLPTLLRTAEKPAADVRIVLLTSLGFRSPPPGGILFDQLRQSTEYGQFPGFWMRYNQSKLANLLYAEELARRYPQITTVSVDPGPCSTELVDKMPLLYYILLRLFLFRRFSTPAQGVLGQIWASVVDKNELKSGAFYEPLGKLGSRTPLSEDRALQEKLWQWTEEQLEAYKA